MTERLVSGNKFASPEEALEHFGVKGMKWGKRKARPSSSDIMDARARQNSRMAVVNERAHKLNLATGKSKDVAAKRYADAVKKLNNNDDVAVAGRLTRGEKVILAAFTGPIGLAVIASNAHSVKKLEREKQAKKK